MVPFIHQPKKKLQVLLRTLSSTKNLTEATQSVLAAGERFCTPDWSASVLPYRIFSLFCLSCFNLHIKAMFTEQISHLMGEQQVGAAVSLSTEVSVFYTMCNNAIRKNSVPPHLNRR